MSFLGIIPKVSQTKFHQIQITKSKVIDVKIPLPKWKKTKRGNKRIKNQGRFQNLQIGAILGISNWGKKITNRVRDYKSGQEGFQNRAEITNRCRTHVLLSLRKRRGRRGGGYKMKQSQGTEFFNFSSNYFAFLKISLIYQLPKCPYSYLFVSVEVLFTGNKEGNI